MKSRGWKGKLSMVQSYDLLWLLVVTSVMIGRPVHTHERA